MPQHVNPTTSESRASAVGNRSFQNSSSSSAELIVDNRPEAVVQRGFKEKLAERSTTQPLTSSGSKVIQLMGLKGIIRRLRGHEQPQPPIQASPESAEKVTPELFLTYFTLFPGLKYSKIAQELKRKSSKENKADGNAEYEKLRTKFKTAYDKVRTDFVAEFNGLDDDKKAATPRADKMKKPTADDALINLNVMHAYPSETAGRLIVALDHLNTGLNEQLATQLEAIGNIEGYDENPLDKEDKNMDNTVDQMGGIVESHSRAFRKMLAWRKHEGPVLIRPAGKHAVEHLKNHNPAKPLWIKGKTIDKDKLKEESSAKTVVELFKHGLVRFLEDMRKNIKTEELLKKWTFSKEKEVSLQTQIAKLQKERDAPHKELASLSREDSDANSLYLEAQSNGSDDLNAEPDVNETDSLGGDRNSDASLGDFATEFKYPEDPESLNPEVAGTLQMPVDDYDWIDEAFVLEVIGKLNNGFIPTNQILSKWIRSVSGEKVKRYLQDNQKEAGKPELSSIEPGQIQQVAQIWLDDTNHTIQEMIQSGIINVSEEGDVAQPAWPPPTPEEGKGVQPASPPTLAGNTLPKTYTGDYDLYAISHANQHYKQEELNNLRGRRIGDDKKYTPSLEMINEKGELKNKDTDAYSPIEDKQDPVMGSNTPHKLFGNLSRYEMGMKIDLNAAAITWGGYKGGQVIKHGSEARNDSFTQDISDGLVLLTHKFVEFNKSAKDQPEDRNFNPLMYEMAGLIHDPIYRQIVNREKYHIPLNKKAVAKFEATSSAIAAGRPTKAEPVQDNPGRIIPAFDKKRQSLLAAVKVNDEDKDQTSGPGENSQGRITSNPLLNLGRTLSFQDSDSGEGEQEQVRDNGDNWDEINHPHMVPTHRKPIAEKQKSLKLKDMLSQGLNEQSTDSEINDGSKTKVDNPLSPTARKNFAKR